MACPADIAPAPPGRRDCRGVSRDRRTIPGDRRRPAVIAGVSHRSRRALHDRRARSHAARGRIPRHALPPSAGQWRARGPRAVLRRARAPPGPRAVLTEFTPRVRLIAIGYNIAGTGLTRVMHSIMERLADRHEIHYLGIGYSGEVVRDRGLSIYPTNPKGGDVFAVFQAKKLIEGIHPDVVFILHDLWLFDYYLRLLGPYRNELVSARDMPFDGKIAREEDATALERADRVVAYTQFGRAQFEGAFGRLREKDGTRNFPAVDVIPHGIDPGRFFPFPELMQASFASSGRAQAKRRVFGESLGGADSF